MPSPATRARGELDGVDVGGVVDMRPPPIIANDEDEVRKDLARLIDSEGCGDEMFVQNARPLRGLAAHLGTSDPEELGALLLAMGMVAR